MAKKRKVKSKPIKDIVGMPNMGITNYKVNLNKKSNTNPPFNTTKPLLANYITTVVIIAILVYFSSLFPKQEKEITTIKDEIIKEALKMDHFPVADSFIDDNYIKKLVKNRITDFHLDKRTYDIDFEDFTYVAEDEVIDYNAPELFPPKTEDENAVKPPMIAIVIDDMGFTGYKTDDFVKLEPPLTLSFLPYVKLLDKGLSDAYAGGHELMIHIPMEALNKRFNDAPDNLTTSMNADKIKEITRNTLKKFKFIVGINNHMGSKFMGDENSLRAFMSEIKDEKIFFLDSKTTPKSVGKKIANEFNVPFAARDIFIDNVQEKGKVLAQLEKLEVIAKKRGYAIGIGHPYKVTLEGLKEWMPKIKAKGFEIVPLSKIINQLKPSS